MWTQREQVIALNMVPGIGSLRMRRLVDAFGSLQALWEAPREALSRVDGIGPELAHRLDLARRDEAAVLREVEAADRLQASIVTLEEAAYPATLRTIHDPPLALYVRGAWREALDAPCVAVVGSRHASLYGLRIAERLAHDLALRGVTVVSGMARGIDAAAHRGTLAAAGRTLAVLGSGLGRVYPPEHVDLAGQIIERGGALVSEYPMGMPPLAQNFPRRNRVISGLSLGVVVVEAAQCSGALITADCALEQGREVFAVPGPVDATTSHGTHELLRQGARLVVSVEDILEELRLTPQPAVPAEMADQRAAPLDGPEALLMAQLTVEPTHIDALAASSGLAADQAAELLLRLELRGLIAQRPGKYFVRKDARPVESGKCKVES